MIPNDPTIENHEDLQMVVKTQEVNTANQQEASSQPEQTIHKPPLMILAIRWMVNVSMDSCRWQKPLRIEWAVLVNQCLHLT